MSLDHGSQSCAESIDVGPAHVLGAQSASNAPCFAAMAKRPNEQSPHKASSHGRGDWIAMSHR